MGMKTEESNVGYVTFRRYFPAMQKNKKKKSKIHVHVQFEKLCVSGLVLGEDAMLKDRSSFFLISTADKRKLEEVVEETCRPKKKRRMRKSCVILQY